jgi:hypothetical protein
MKIRLSLIFLFTLSSTVFGQVNNEAEMIGDWKVEKILEKPTNPQFKPLIDGFESSTFKFKPNKNFELTTTNSSELFEMMMTEVLDGTKWKFVKEKQLIKIGTEEDGYTSMGVLVKKENGHLFFNLDESGLIFLMKKTD